MNKKPTSIMQTRRQQGFSLLEMVGALAVSSMMLMGLAYLIDTGLEDTKGQQTALYQKRFVEGVGKFIQDPTQNTFIKTNATTTTPVKVQVANLTAGNFISPGTAATNAYGQTACALVYYNSASDRIDTVITTEGGTAIPAKQLGYVASNTGDNGGSISAASPTLAKGVFGSWQITLATYTDATAAKNCTGTPAGAGHLANLLAQEASGTLQSDFLYRNQLTGRPDLNTMNTPIIMSASTVQTPLAACTPNGSIGRDSNGKLLSCQSGVWKGQGSTYWEDPVATFASLPACNASNSWQTRVVQTPTVGTKPRAYTCNGAGAWLAIGLDDSGNLTLEGSTIYAGGSNATYGALTVQGAKGGWSGINFRDGTGANQGTLMMNASTAGFYNAQDTGWRYYVDNSGNSYQPGTITPGLVVAENGSCAGYNTGAMAQSSTNAGLILSCQSGVWKQALTTGKGMVGRYVTWTAGGCWQVDPNTGWCSCPSGSSAYISGFGWAWKKWDHIYWSCIKL